MRAVRRERHDLSQSANRGELLPLGQYQREPYDVPCRRTWRQQPARGPRDQSGDRRPRANDSRQTPPPGALVIDSVCSPLSHARPAWSDGLRRRCEAPDLAKHETRGRDIGDALTTVFDEATLEKTSNGWRHLRRECRPVWFEADDRAHYLGDVVTIKRSLARQHLVEHTAERPDISSLVDLLAFRLLGCHVGGGAKDHSSSRGHRAQRRRLGDIRNTRGTFERLRQSEVEHLHRAVCAYFDVRRFQIAMNDPVLMRPFKGFDDLLRDR